PVAHDDAAHARVGGGGVEHAAGQLERAPHPGQIVGAGGNHEDSDCMPGGTARRRGRRGMAPATGPPPDVRIGPAMGRCRPRANGADGGTIRLRTLLPPTLFESAMKQALIVIDAQESFRHRPYWDDTEVAPYLRAQQAVVDAAVARGIPVLQVFHIDRNDD